MKSRLVFILPLIGFAVLAVFLFKGLFGRPADEIPSVMLNKPAPLDRVPALDAQTQGFGPKELKSGKVIVESGKLVGSSSDGRWVERRVSGDVLGRPAV